MGKWCVVKCNCFEPEPDLPSAKARNTDCSHKGIFLELWPGDLIGLGYGIEDAFGKASGFEFFTKIGDWQQYEDEYLKLSPEDAQLWELEIEQLKRYLSGEESMGWHERRKWDEYFATHPPLYSTINEILEDGLNLIRASQKMSRPIEFFW